MFFYFFQFLFYAFISLVKDKRFQQCIFYITLIFYFFLSFSRWECGTDGESYLQIFINSTVLNPYYEKAFAYLNYWIRNLTTNYTYFLFTESIIIFLGIYYSFKRIPTFYPIIVLLAFLSLFRFNVFFVRQDIAIILCLCSYTLLIQRKTKRAIIIWLLAILFHNSALIFIFAFFLYNRKVSNKLVLLLILFSFLSSQLCEVIFKFLLDKTGIHAFSIVYYYIKSGRNQTYGYGGGLSTFFVIARSAANRILLLLFLFVCKRKYHNDSNFNAFFNFYLFSACLFIAFAPLNFALARVSSIFSIYEIFLYPYLINYPKKKYSKLLMFCMILSWLALRFYTGIENQYEVYVPYKLKGF